MPPKKEKQKPELPKHLLARRVTYFEGLLEDLQRQNDSLRYLKGDYRTPLINLRNSALQNAHATPVPEAASKPISYLSPGLKSEDDILEDFIKLHKVLPRRRPHSDSLFPFAKASDTVSLSCYNVVRSTFPALLHPNRLYNDEIINKVNRKYHQTEFFQKTD
jgi:hypothetical protein